MADRDQAVNDILKKVVPGVQAGHHRRQGCAAAKQRRRLTKPKTAAHQNKFTISDSKRAEARPRDELSRLGGSKERLDIVQGGVKSLAQNDAPAVCF